MGWGFWGVKEKRVEVSAERSAEAVSVLGVNSKRSRKDLTVSLSCPISLSLCLSLSPNDVLGQCGKITEGILGG